jgi:hypothetical protein
VATTIATEGTYLLPANESDDDSAIVVSLTTQLLSDMGSSHTPDDYVAGYVGEEAFFTTLFNGGEFDDFVGAFDLGAVWHEVDLGDAYGPALTIDEVSEGCS